MYRLFFIESHVNVFFNVLYFSVWKYTEEFKTGRIVFMVVSL